MEGMFGYGIDKYIRVGERASLVGMEPAFRSETGTRRVTDCPGKE